MWVFTLIGGVWIRVYQCSPLVWALILLVIGPLSFGHAQDGIYALFPCTFLARFVYFHKFPPTNGKSPKPVEFVSCNP